MKAIIFDYGYTLVDVDRDELYPGVEELLRELKKKTIKMAILSRTENPEKRHQDFKRFKLDKYFDFLDVIPRGSTKSFDHILQALQVDTKNVLIVGDRIKSEIMEGNKNGIITVWFKHGKYSEELPESEEEQPKYTIKSLTEVLDLI